MKQVLQLEEAAMTGIAIYFLGMYNLGLPVWLWMILFFSPDIGMLGYLLNKQIGAVTYNLFHHKGIALAIAMGGYLWGNEIMTALGILLFAHASFDRIWGYGLKYFAGFKSTHLGSLEKSRH
jgi:Domain of unknown function (DUF4260)